jgi:hypothetical protein
MPTNPDFRLLGYIAFNRLSGEVAFFDGSYQGADSDKRFNWNTPTVAPGGTGYGDDQGRAESVAIYDSTFRIDCAACHNNKEPRIITAYIKQARVGYRNADLQNAFSLGALLPDLHREITKPYRVVGSAYTAVHANTIAVGRAFDDPTGQCKRCHGFTNLGTARFTSDSVARLGSLSGDSAVENNYRSAWALRSGEGKIHPWMVPNDGNDISAEPPPDVMSDSDWNALKAMLEASGPDPRQFKLYTEAPAPESAFTDEARVGDPSAPQLSSPTVADNRDGISEKLPKEIDISWDYLNSFGAVPERDDVRFNVSILEVDIPATGSAPSLDQYPSIETTKGIGATRISGDVYRDGDTLIVKDISFVGHTRWTDPAGTKVPRHYRLAFPAETNKRYLVRVLAKRFCFDQSDIKYSGVDHVLAVDVH